jgi:hypothetical protein
MPMPALALLLIALGVLCRLGPVFSHYAYFGVPMAAVALYAGARLPRRWAVAVPLVVLLLSDLYIDPNHAYRFDYASRLTTYTFFGLFALVGAYLPRRAGVPTWLLAAGLGETAFWLVSNFAVWAESGGLVRDHNLAGLMQTYADAVPFYRAALEASLIATAALLGTEAVLERLTGRPVVKLAEAEVVEGS